jgi:ribosomal protein L11 methyltransferase
MIKAFTEIPSSNIEHLEDYLYEIAPSPWVLIINYLNGSGSLAGYFDCQVDAQLAITEIEKFSTTLPFNFLEIQDQDWKEAYKDHFHPWKYKNFHLIPSWMKEDYPVPTDHLSLILDPGMAFGTGNHETTRMCLELLIDELDSSEDNGSMLDLGCGSGLLSLAASLLGYGPQIVGLDNDDDAVRISKENAEINLLADKVTFMVGDLYKLNKDIGQFDYIVANIQADVLKNNAKNIFSLSHSQSTIILSGILAYEIEDVIEAFNKHAPKKLLELSVKEMGEWASAKFTRLE